MMRRPAYRTGGVRFGHGFPMSRWVLRLMIANFAIFLLMAMRVVPVGAVDWLGFAVPGFLMRPWTIVTYMFVHGGFMHVFMNMLALFFFGPPLEQKWGSRFFLRFYLVTGLGAAAFSVLLYSLTGPTIMVGASGAIFGILVAFALNWPDAKIYLYFVFPVPAKWFVAALGAFTLLSTVQGSADGVAHWAHLGGLVTGFVYLRYGERIGRLANSVLYKERLASPRGRARRAEPPPDPTPRRRRRADGDSLDEVDRILDKIRASGMDSLSARERAFLDEVSRQYQQTQGTRKKTRTH
ncbi:MAG: rhomboid family intramembrane serine protease [Gemmatimonadales bacterium]|nr:rhomboid family intramembrane serine protease [Gemmatimonadales bacterium]MYG48728.1 rhomboid family intramembrane serine protease [Gemmatimonadales bacterium]MYK02297.1 rhomboid family intramembrane serine protease [Candidatus Palauibacter ramosifaciens]